ALAGIIGSVSGDAADLLACRDLAEQVGQDRCITDMAPGDLDSADLQCLLVDSEVDLAPDAPLGAAVLARVPLAFALNLDAGAVDQQVQRPFGATIRNVDGEGLLASAQRAEVGHRPVKADQAQQAFDEPGRLPECHAEQHLHCQASLNGSIAVCLLATTLACRRGIPGHLGVKPDRQRAPALERFIVGWPVPGLVSRGCVSAHASQLPHWIHEMNPSPDLCNRASGCPFRRHPRTPSPSASSRLRRQTARGRPESPRLCPRQPSDLWTCCRGLALRYPPWKLGRSLQLTCRPCPWSSKTK